MGLDQYSYFVKNKQEIEDKNDEFMKLLDAGKKYQDLPKAEDFYWRKHPNLEGWMSKLYYKKGGDGDFNGEYVELLLEDVLELEQVLIATRNEFIANSKDFIADAKQETTAEPFEATQGFFFGGDSSEHYSEQDFEFIEGAKEALSKGLKVLYISSW